MFRQKLTTTIILCGLLAAVVFIGEVLTPQGFAEATLYAIVVLLALRASSIRFVVVVALSCSVLTLLGYYISPISGMEGWEYIGDRGFALLGIWLVTVLGLMIQSSQIKSDRLQAIIKEKEDQLRLARSIQQKLFPTRAPAIAGFDIAGICHPADATGGDYYDFIPLADGCLGVAVGDVSGHGIGPALLMADTHAFLRALAPVKTGAGEILTEVNRLVWDDLEDEQFITIFLARLDPSQRSFAYAAAGQEAYLLGAGGQAAELRGSGLPLGVDQTDIITSASPVGLSGGDLVLIMTDGVYEAKGPDGSMFGVERALDFVRAGGHGSAREIADGLFGAVREYAGDEPQRDDITVVIIKAAPSG